MDAEQERAGIHFVVRPDGSVVGNDGADGSLAAALPYTGRLARRMGELVGAGDLRVLEAFGVDRLTVGVTWTPAGEGTYRAAVTPLPPRTLPHYMVVGAPDTTLAVDHCLDRLVAVDGVEWGSIVTAGARVIAATGEQQALLHLAEVGNRMLAILRSLEDRHATGFTRLGYEGGAVVGASIGRHALVAYAGRTTDDELVGVIDEIRAVLAGHDLSAVADFDPDGRASEPAPTEAVEAVLATPPPLVGARSGGPRPPREKKPRRSRFGLLSPSRGGTPRTSPRA